MVAKTPDKKPTSDAEPASGSRRKRKHTAPVPADDGRDPSADNPSDIKTARGQSALDMLRKRKEALDRIKGGNRGSAGGSALKSDTEAEAVKAQDVKIDAQEAIRRRREENLARAKLAESGASTDAKKATDSRTAAKLTSEPSTSKESAGVALAETPVAPTLGPSFNADDTLSKLRSRRQAEKANKTDERVETPVLPKTPVRAPTPAVSKPEPQTENLSQLTPAFKADDALSKMRQRRAEKKAVTPEPSEPPAVVPPPIQATESGKGVIVVKSASASDGGLQAHRKDDGIAFTAEMLQAAARRALIVSNRIAQVHLAYRVLITLTGGEIDLITCKNFDDLRQRDDFDRFGYAMVDKTLENFEAIMGYLKASNSSMKIKSFEDLKGAPGAD
ncbi:MAG: hypothetical protein ABIH86_05670 [Planctomycetota bacterium]